MVGTQIFSDLLRGHTDTVVLSTLVGGDHYGYEIIQVVREKSMNGLQLRDATLYSCLRRLQSSGSVTWYWGDETQGGRRKYYSITVHGRAIHEENRKKWENTKAIMDLLL